MFRVTNRSILRSRVDAWNKRKSDTLPSTNEEKRKQANHGRTRTKHERKETYMPNTLFILNILILSHPNTSLMPSSHMISRRFDGFCSSFPFI